MLVFKESTYIENRKYYEGVDDYLVREYHDIFNKIDEVENYPAPSEIVSYLYRELEGIEVYNKVAYLITFFNKAIKMILRPSKYGRRILIFIWMMKDMLKMLRCL